MNDAYKIFRQLEEKAKRTNQYKFYDKDELIDVIDEQNQEIERLNNIIDGLKKDLEKLVEESISRRKESKSAMEHSLNSAYMYAYMESLDKLKELKEGR